MAQPNTAPEKAAETSDIGHGERRLDAARQIPRLQREGVAVTGPKILGCFGASYLYPVFIRIVRGGDALLAGADEKE